MEAFPSNCMMWKFNNGQDSQKQHLELRPDGKSDLKERIPQLESFQGKFDVIAEVTEPSQNPSSLLVHTFFLVHSSLPPLCLVLSDILLLYRNLLYYTSQHQHRILQSGNQNYMDPQKYSTQTMESCLLLLFYLSSQWNTKSEYTHNTRFFEHTVIYKSSLLAYNLIKETTRRHKIKLGISPEHKLRIKEIRWA